MTLTESYVLRSQDTTGDKIKTIVDDSEHLQVTAIVNISDINDIEDIGLITYVGIETATGTWTIKKIDETNGISIRYATIINNTAVTNYVDAWANRASLTYDTYASAF